MLEYAYTQANTADRFRSTSNLETFIAVACFPIAMNFSGILLFWRVGDPN